MLALREVKCKWGRATIRQIQIDNNKPEGPSSGTSAEPERRSHPILPQVQCGCLGSGSSEASSSSGFSFSSSGCVSVMDVPEFCI